MAAATGSRLRDLIDAPGVPVVVPFTDRDDLDEIRRCRRSGCDVVELRVDRFERIDVESVVAFASALADVPTIATIRSSDEGGEWSGDDAGRRELFEALIPVVDAIDVEIASAGSFRDVIRSAQESGRDVIASAHDFEATPARADLDALAEQARGAGADVLKVAAMAQGPDDVRTLASFLLDTPGDAVVIAMGDHGSLSRVFFPALGSVVTYAHGGSFPVPGQLDLAMTVDLLQRFLPDSRRG